MNVLSRVFVVAAGLFLVTLALGACATSGVEYERTDLSVELIPRPPECHIDDFELGREAEHQHPFKVTGTLVWKLSKLQIKSLGPDGVRNKLHRAACSYGLFLVSEITAYPNTKKGGATYEAKGAVLVDEKGRAINAAAAPQTKPESTP